MSVTSPQGRFAESAAVLDQTRMVEATAHGKHLFCEFAADRFLHVHLGLIGKFTIAPEAPPWGEVRVRIAADGRAADLRGPQQCAVVTRSEIDATMAQLGPDPLRPDADPELAWRRIRRASRPIAALLMDQTILSGVGNVYRAEVLFRNRVDPHRPGNKLSRRSWLGIWSDLVALMPEGVRDNRIDTVRPDHTPEAMGRPAAPRRPRRRGLRLPPHRDALLGLRRQGADRAARRAEPLLVWPVSAPGLTYALGRGSVVLQPDGSIPAVRPGPDATSYLTGGPVRVWIGGTAVVWPEPTVAADVDEVEFGGTAAEGLGLVVRHSFTADWGVRVALVNHTLEPLALTAELAWTPADLCPGLGAGRRGDRGVRHPGSGRPRSVARRRAGARHLRRGHRDRHRAGPPRARSAGAVGGAVALGLVRQRPGVLPEPVPRRAPRPGPFGERVRADRGRRGHRGGRARGGHGPPRSAPRAHRCRRAAGERRGPVAPGYDGLRPGVGRAARRCPGGGRRRAAGGAADAGPGWSCCPTSTPPWSSSTCWSGDGRAARTWPTTRWGCSSPAPSEAPTGDGRGVSLLCGEFDRTGDPDLLEQATAHLLALDRPVPGLGLAAAQVCVARLSQGWPLDPVLTHLGGLAETAGEDGLDRVAAEPGAPAHRGPAGGGPRSRPGPLGEDRVRRVGAALGAGLRGRPLWPLPVDRQAHLAVVLGLLPEGLGARVRPDWGVPAHDVARHAGAAVLARLAGQAPCAAHSWLIMGGRLA